MKIKSMTVIGGGVMGRQIALNAVIHGFKVQLYDAFWEEVNPSVAAWEKDYLDGRVKKGKLTKEEAGQAAENLILTTSLETAVAGSQLVLECIRERQDEKEALFRELNQLVGPEVILATNSSMMVSSLFADCVDHPERLLNIHYFNPALVMTLVEVVQGAHTSAETVNTVMDFCRQCGKQPIHLRREIEGFAVNRIIRVVKNEARYLVQNGYLTPQEVDMACEKGLNHPMGPFRLNDFTGLDLQVDMMNAEYEKTGVKPDCYDMFVAMVAEGKLGKKSGHGFYDYE